MKKEEEKSLVDSLHTLVKFVDQLRSQKYLQMVDNPRRFLTYSLLSGVASGIGTAIGASIAFAGVIWILSQLSILPFLGDWIATLLEYVQKAR